jgi:hypothetical protein
MGPAGAEHPPPAVGEPLRGAGPGDVGKERDLIGGQAETQDDRRHHEQQRRDRQAGGDVAIRGTPRVQRLLQRPPPEAALLPKPRPPSIGGKQGADGADAASRHEVDAHARFGQRVERAGVVRAVDARAGQHERCASIWGVMTARDVRVSKVMHGDELHDLERSLAVRRHHVDFVALFLADNRPPDRRGRGDEPLLDVGVFRHDELEDHGRPGGLEQVHGRSEGGLCRAGSCRG